MPALQAYLDRTSDLQSVALICSTMVPSRFRDPLAERWIEAYRSLLDTWGLQSLRAAFDLARREQSEQGDTPAPALRPAGTAAPAQIYVRCNACEQSLSLAMMAPSKMSLRTAGARAGNSVARVKACPSPKCRETLPRCVLCLLPMEASAPLSMSMSSADSALLQDNYYTFCTLCRHGGHADHVLDWFASNDACAASGCGCNCLNA